MLNRSEDFNRHRLLMYFGICFVLLYFVFAPAINILYYHGDDFRYAFGGASKSCSTDDGFYFMLTLGRPLQAYLDCLSYKFAFTLERMSILRGVSVALMAGAIALLADWLCELGFSFWGAFFVAGSMIVVPRLYDDTVTTAATSLPISIIFALVAYRCLNRAHACQDFFAKKWQSKEVKWSVAAITFLILAFLSYPATSFIFGTLILTKVLFSPLKKWETTRWQIINEAGIFIVAAILYFAWAFYNMRYHPQAPIPDQYHVDHPNLNPIEIILRFGVLANVFTEIWQILPGANIQLQGWIIIALLTVGLFLSIRHFVISQSSTIDKSRNWSHLGQAIIAACCMIGLSSAFFLVIPTRDLGSRLLFGPLAAGMVVLAFCLNYVVSIFPQKTKVMLFTLTVGVLFFVEAHFANQFEFKQALYSANRMDFLKDKIEPSLSKNEDIKRIHFILSESEYPYNRFFQVNAVLVQLLGHNQYHLEWCSLARGIPGAEKDHQSEMLACLNKLPGKGIGITYSFLNEPITKTKDMLVIRMDNTKL